MRNLPSWIAALFFTAFATSNLQQCQAQSAGLKLIPIPRDISAAGVQPLTSGVQVSCNAPCSPEDAFAVSDFKAWLATIGVPVNTSSPVNILVARYGTA